MNALTQPQRLLASTALSLPPGISTPDYVSLYNQRAETWGYDIDPATGVSRAAYMGEVFIGGLAAANQAATKGDIAASTTGVSEWNGRTGIVTMTLADVTGVGGAPAASPTFTGTPAAPTAAPGTSTTALATTAFVQAAIGANPSVASWNGRSGAVTMTLADVTGVGGAPIASPGFSGLPTAPTAPGGTNTTQLATCGFVANALAGSVATWNGRFGNVTLNLTDVLSVGGAPVASPNFTGTPQGPTAAPGTATQQLATTAFVTNAVTGATSGVASFNTRTGAVTLQAADISGANGALLTSPNFTGTPTAPTAAAATNTNQIATTAFVTNALAGTSLVSSFNGRTGAITLSLSDVTGAGGAPQVSPALTGTPTAPTATAGTNNTQIASTAFVGAAVGTAIGGLAPIPGPATQLPNMNGTASAGTATLYSRGDHTHPTDTSRAAASALAGYLPLTGGSLSGNLALPTLTFPAYSGTTFAFSYDAGNTALIPIINGDASNWTIMSHSVPGSYSPIFQEMISTGADLYVWWQGGSAGYVPLQAPSDRRLKSNIEPATVDALGIINGLAVYECDVTLPWGGNPTHWDCSLMADEVGAVIPPAWIKGQAESYDSIRDLPVIATLVRAVQQLTERMTAAEATLAAFRAV